MSDDSREIVPIRSLNRIRDTEHNTWYHRIDGNRPWTDALTREYWALVGHKVKGGDFIDVASADSRIQFRILVISANAHVTPAFLDFGFLPVWPRDLELPQPSPQLPPRF